MSGSHYQIDTQNSYDSLFNLCQTCNSIDCSCDSVLDINSIDTASTGNRETEIHVLQCDADCPSTASHSAKSSDIDNNNENDRLTMYRQITFILQPFMMMYSMTIIICIITHVPP